jgi:hypothetical protein
MMGSAEDVVTYRCGSYMNAGGAPISDPAQLSAHYLDEIRAEQTA